jgi:hypothetical protein
MVNSGITTTHEDRVEPTSGAVVRPKPGPSRTGRTPALRFAGTAGMGDPVEAVLGRTDLVQRALDDGWLSERGVPGGLWGSLLPLPESEYLFDQGDVGEVFRAADMPAI